MDLSSSVLKSSPMFPLNDEGDTEHSGDCGSLDGSSTISWDPLMEALEDDQFYFDISIKVDQPLLNEPLQLTAPGTKIESVTLDRIYRFAEDGEPISLETPLEQTIAYPDDSITFVVSGHDSDGKEAKYCQTYRAHNGTYFTVKDLVMTIVKFEAIARNYRRFGGSIDLTNLTFSGLTPGTIDGSVVSSDMGCFLINWQ